MSGLVIKPRSRIFHGHDWVFSTEVSRPLGEPEPGEVIVLKDVRGRPLGSAIYNPASQIVARRFSRRKQELDTDFFLRRIGRALGWREHHGVDARLCRIVWSESDGLPGVIVDRYGDHLVLQTLTLAMDQRRESIADALVEIFKPRSIIERNDTTSRKAEGLESRTGVLRGDAPEPFRVDANGLPLEVDLMDGQKTGLYLDQLANYGEVARWASGRKVLDCFSNQGGFALACARAGAAEVTAVESSEQAVARGRANSQLIDASIQWEASNAFDFLKKSQAGGREADLIVLDPPSFTRTRKAVGDALRGYKEIHLRSLKILQPGGILATFCCSHHVGRSDFLKSVKDASVDAKKNLRQIASFTQSPDHPIVPTMPETEYLKGFAFEVVPAW